MNEENSSRQPSTEQELATCTTQLAEITQRYTYLSADFDTYRRRTEKERIMWMAEAEARILRSLLAVVDDFERAYTDLQSAQSSSELAGRIQGFELVRKSIIKLLVESGVEEIAATGEFDPTFHESLMQVADSGKPAGSIVAVLQKGYKHRGVVLRPARVSVAA